MNKVILIGNLVKDVELNNYSNSVKSNFRIAVNKNKDTTLFFDCVAWNQTATFMAQYCAKGSKVAVEGELDIFKSQKQDGTTSERYYVNCIKVELLQKSTAVTNTDIDNAEKNFNQKVSQNVNTNQITNNDVIDDDLPF